MLCTVFLVIACIPDIGNQEKTPKCWCVILVRKGATPSVFSQPWILFQLTAGNAE